ncbi:MAG: hypothetical protein WCO94_03520 [Verrucomicrobiota bacterium]
MATTSLSPNIIVCPKEYQTGEWGQTLSNSDVWEGPMAELLLLQQDIKGSYTTTQLTPTKGGHGKLTATITTTPNSSEPGAPKGDITIEVEWVELRLPIESNPAFAEVTPQYIAWAKMWAKDPSTYTGPSLGEGTPVSKLATLLSTGPTEFSTGVPVVRRTTKNASNLAKGFAWYRDTPPVDVPRGGSGGSWEWMKTVDRRTRVGTDIQMIEEWTGSLKWDSTLYP